MRTMTVTFEGLMLHVGDDRDTAGMKKNHVALVNDARHTPLVKIDGDDLIPKGADFENKLRKGDTVRFGAASPASTDADFRELVPHLRPLLKDGDLDQLIKTASHKHKNAIAFVEYSGGDLSVPGTFDHQARFLFSDGTEVGSPQCVARLVVYERESPDIATLEIVHHDKDGNQTGVLPISIRGDATIRISNTSTSGKHFHLFRGFTSASDMALATEDRTLDCPEGAERILPFVARGLVQKTSDGPRSASDFAEETEAEHDPADVGMRVSPHPECTNTNWP
jgi:hypothetical protein